MKCIRDYDEIWAVDFEFHAPGGSRPSPIVMVAKEVRTGRLMRLDEDALRRCDVAPFDVGGGSLLLAYYASAEFGCFLELGWPLPINVIDLFVEFRNLSNGLKTSNGQGLLGALVWCGLPPGDGFEKEEMRGIAMRGGPFSADEIAALMVYCESDVNALVSLWGVLKPRLDASALVRGNYMKAVAAMERTGVPIDTATLSQLQSRWDDFKRHLIGEIDPRGEIWQQEKFSEERFQEWLRQRGIPWRQLESGRLKLDQDTWSDMGKLHPQVKPVAELRSALSKLRLGDLSLGADGRNRALLSPFRSRSGRNQPSTSKFIFGTASWLRALIQPEPGHALAYVDWSQQEFGIGAVLSGDQAMQEAYTSSDPYLAFAIQAGAAPRDATKSSHPVERGIYKTVVLGVGYGMSAFGLASRLGISCARGEELLRIHKRCFPKFWKWSQGAADYAQLRGMIHTRYGWKLHFTGETKDRSVRNFPCQANGAEMMRLAAIYATKAGIRICAPVHDAFLVEAPIARIQSEARRMQACMARASGDVLDGFQLDTDAEFILSPGRFGGNANILWKLAAAFVAN